eukprot:scaffold33956_cov29-Tisochrysis_lutea.AAC.8
MASPPAVACPSTSNALDFLVTSAETCIASSGVPQLRAACWSSAVSKARGLKSPPNQVTRGKAAVSSPLPVAVQAASCACLASKSSTHEPSGRSEGHASPAHA